MTPPTPRDRNRKGPAGKFGTAVEALSDGRRQRTGGASAWRQSLSEPLRKSDPPSIAAFHLPPRPVAIIDQTHPARAAAEALVEERFRAAYGASIRRHYRVIAGLMSPDGQPNAVAGVRLAEEEPLFLERYLDDPVEQALARAFGRPVVREQVVEIGGFAADGAEPALALFTGLSAWLAGAGERRFAVATARPELQRLLGRAGFGLRTLGEADPARLGDEAAEWGSYYDAAPMVFAGEIGVSTVLPDLCHRLRTKALARQVRRLRSGAQ